MTARTFDELFEPQIRLSLAQAPGGWIVWDQACRYYVLSPSSLWFCLRFMKAMEAKGDAVIDEESVERALAGWSVKVPALEEVERGTDGTDGRSASSNVVPIRAEYPCHCKLWEQRWMPETPAHCANCGGLFPAHTVDARRPMPGDAS